MCALLLLLQVTVAEEIENKGVPGGVVVSGETFDHLDYQFECERLTDIAMVQVRICWGPLFNTWAVRFGSRGLCLLRPLFGAIILGSPACSVAPSRHF